MAYQTTSIICTVQCAKVNLIGHFVVVHVEFVACHCTNDTIL